MKTTRGCALIVRDVGQPERKLQKISKPNRDNGEFQQHWRTRAKEKIQPVHLIRTRSFLSFASVFECKRHVRITALRSHLAATTGDDDILTTVNFISCRSRVAAGRQFS